MGIRDILVHLKAHQSWSSHIDYSVELAKLFDARLRAVVTFHEVVLLLNLPPYGGPELESQIAKDVHLARELEGRFRTACAVAGVNCEFATSEGAAGEILPWTARLHDLTVVQQREPVGDELHFAAAERTAVNAGRPVLLHPRSGNYHARPEHVLVSWNGSAHAATALHGAMPLLQHAKKVTVCSCEGRPYMQQGSRVPDIDLAGYLERYVSEVSVERVELSARLLGEHLVSRARELECDLMVAGIDGRTWLSDYLWGGASRRLFRELPVPVISA